MAPQSAYEDSPSGVDHTFDVQDIMNSRVSDPGRSHTSASAGISPFNTFDMVPSPIAAMEGFPDIPSPNLGLQAMSGDSVGQFTRRGRHNSSAASDATSPGDRRFQQSNIGTGNAGMNQPSAENGQSQPAAEKSKQDDHTVPPTWSELKTKAGKERKRLPLACIACRRKKIRCSGEKPACKHCLRSRIPCVYKVTARKAAPRTDYMAMLDKRLKRMEDRVIKCIPKEEQAVVNSTGRAVVRPPLPPAPSKATGSSKKRAAEQAFGDELDEWAADKKEISATVEESHAEQPREPLKTQVKDPEEQNLLLEGADKLPEKELQEHLAEVFFDYVYGQSYHLLHKPSFMRRVAQGTVPPVLMLSVCAISARFSDHPAVRTEPAFLRGESWASAARDIALRRYDTPNITILICYLILGLHEFGTCQGGRSWMFGGMAQRMAYALQLHKDLDHDPKDRTTREKNELTFTDREIRRRTMWSCFLMDRFNSSGTDRPIFVREQYIRAQLPIKESYYQMEINGPTEDLEGSVPNPVEAGQGQMANAKDNMGVAAYLVRLVSIWGKLINYLNLGGKERDQHPMWSKESMFYTLKTATEEWKVVLPESLQYSEENLQNHASEKIANQFLFLHIVYYQILLFMNRFALPTPGTRPFFPDDMPEDFISEASRTALESANQISALINKANDHLVVAPFAGYCAFFSSTVHLHGAFSKNAQLEATSKQNLAWNVKYLTKVKKYWGMFHFVTENLRDLYRRHADAARSGAETGKEDEKAIFQYGDWFDRYPHGVRATDFEEPSVDAGKEPGSDAVLGQKSDLQTVEEFFSKMSPPSRAAIVAQQSSSRKAAKKRHSKSEGHRTAQAGIGQMQQNGNNRQDAQQQAQAQQVTHDLNSTQAFANNMDFQQQQLNAFASGLQAPLNPLLAPQFMSQLDRQMVMNSYANQNMPNMNTAMLEQGGGNIGNFDWNAFANNIQPDQGAYGLWGDPSTAWFMPFNMDPPTVPDDSDMFAGNFDWSNGFAEFGDMSAMPSTGMTPGQSIDVETGQDPMMDQNVVSLDDLDQMQ